MPTLTEEKISIFMSKQGEQCPLCESKNFENAVPDCYASGTLSQSAFCHDCSAEWVTEYHLADVSVNEDNHTQQDPVYLFTAHKHYFVVYADLDYTLLRSTEVLPSLATLHQRVCDACDLVQDEVEGNELIIKRVQGKLVLIDSRGWATAIYTDCLEQWLEDFKL